MVDYHGDMNQIIKICKNKKIHIVEDAATALGAKIGNKPLDHRKFQLPFLVCMRIKL